MFKKLPEYGLNAIDYVYTRVLEARDDIGIRAVLGAAYLEFLDDISVDVMPKRVLLGVGVTLQIVNQFRGTYFPDTDNWSDYGLPDIDVADIPDYYPEKDKVDK